MPSADVVNELDCGHSERALATEESGLQHLHVLRTSESGNQIPRVAELPSE
jgi:hypothetical protein